MAVSCLSTDFRCYTGTLMTITFKLTHDEPRLVYLALVYHLGRPGSELDPVTKQPSARGLREVKVALGREVAADSAMIEVDEAQSAKLLSALYGCATELRGHHLRDGATSTVARFTETARDLFPQLQDPEEALAIAEAMVMLHRRMERALKRALAPVSAPANAGGEASSRSDRRWPFRR